MGLGFFDLMAALAMVMGGVYLIEMLGRLFVTWRIGIASVKRIQNEDQSVEMVREVWNITNGKLEPKDNTDASI